MVMYILYGIFGIIYAVIAFTVKKYTINRKKIVLDIASTIIRYVALFIIFWYTLQKFTGNKTLLLCSFLCLYIVTLIFLIKRQKL